MPLTRFQNSQRPSENLEFTGFSDGLFLIPNVLAQIFRIQIIRVVNAVGGGCRRQTLYGL
ncbi:hypothetical protein HMPREF9120_00135 [Neisseria sp. oral taxon 020 str. F0370]|nr:hypothetical protein HMPREF9120_00135 [Neisseria sp. oral taxon 020 str. F0370]